MSLKFCRLCGEKALLPLSVDQTGNQWFRCQGCQCEQSDAVYKPETYQRPIPARLECSPTPIRWLVELHANLPVGGEGYLRRATSQEPGNLHLFSPSFLERTLREIGFTVLSQRTQGGEQLWHLKKTDGL
jgi:hypothetical protein